MGQFAQQQSAAVLMDRVLQTSERLLAQTKAKRTRDAIRPPAKGLLKEKMQALESSCWLRCYEKSTDYSLCMTP